MSLSLPSTRTTPPTSPALHTCAHNTKVHNEHAIDAIIHTPHGDGSPYVSTLAEQLHRPVGGDMLTIGFLTEPGDAGTAAALHWTRNGRAQTPIGGRAQARYTSLTAGCLSWASSKRATP